MRSIILVAIFAASPGVAQHHLTPAAAKTFNIVARQFTYTITPAQFVVNRGDSVTINFSVADNGTGDGHGFFLELYAQGTNIRKTGQTLKIEFVAHTTGTFTFFCTQFCGVGHNTMSGTFIVNESFPPPVISTITPSRGSTKGHTNVVIRGSGFQQNAKVRFGTLDAPEVRFGSAADLIAETPPQAAGTVNVVVTNPDGQSATRAGGYEYVEPEPQVLSVSPSAGTTAGGTAITIQGVDFKSGATVKIGSRSALGAVFVNARTLTAITPLGPSDVATTRADDVTVTNPDARSGRKENGFTWQRGAPSITSISPERGIGGTNVIISGTGFTTALATTVIFGGFVATNLQVIDAVTLTAVAPPHAAGAVNVQVQIGSDTATAAGAFTYLPAGPRRRSVRK